MVVPEDASFGLPGIFDNIRDGLILVRLPQLEIVLFNRAAADLTGVREADALHQPLESVVPAKDVLRMVLESGRHPVGAWPGHDQDTYLTQVPTRHGPVDLDLHFCRVEDLGGPLVLLVLRPAEEGRLGVAIRQWLHASRRVGELEEDVGALETDAKALALHLSEATHEFNTPLTVIALQAELLRQAIGPEAPLQSKALGIITANVHRLVLLAQDLTDLSRAESGRLLATVGMVDVARLAESQVANFAALAAEKGVVLHFAGPGAAVAVPGDAARLRQALDNFINNAIKFTPRGGHVTVTVTPVEDGATVEVQDTGPGMAPEDMARLFQPFVRIASKGNLKKPGTGLGLHIAKRIVEAHGGEVGCTSEGLGKGMTFWMKLPVAPPAVDESGQAEASRPRARRRRASRPTRQPAADEPTPPAVAPEADEEAQPRSP